MEEPQQAARMSAETQQAASVMSAETQQAASVHKCWQLRQVSVRVARWRVG